MTINQRPAKHLRLANTAFFFISGFGYATWASRIPTIQHQLHLNEAQLGTLLFAMPIGLMATLPITARVLSAYSSRAVMLFGALFFSVVLVFVGFTTTAWQLALALFCLGSARNLLNISSNAQAVGVQSLYDKSIMATFHGIWSLAGFAGAAVGGLMVFYNISTAWHLLTVSILLLVFSIWAYPATMYQQPIPQTNKKLFTIPPKPLLKFALICFASMACENTMYDWSGIYFGQVIHLPKNTATAGFVAYMIAMTGGRFLGDKLVNKYGVKKLLKFSGIFIFSGFIIAIILPYAITAGVGFILVGLGISCIVPMVFQTAGKSTTMSSGAALASISTIGYLGFLLVPPFVGYVAQAAGLRWSFGIISILGLLIVFLVKDIGNADQN
ncbi:MAG: MFS transporter [Mucilaginibacter sp.]